MAESLSPELGFHSHTLQPPLVVRDGMEGDGAAALTSPAKARWWRRELCWPLLVCVHERWWSCVNGGTAMEARRMVTVAAVEMVRG